VAVNQFEFDVVIRSRQPGTGGVTIWLMEPISTVTGAWSIAKNAGEASKKLYEVWKNIKDREIKHQVEEILDRLTHLKQAASELDDENRDLREKLRFKSDEYEFRTPFRYHRARPAQPLCVKCFAKNIEAPMGEPGHSCSPDFRRCLVCENLVEVAHSVDMTAVLTPEHPFGD